MTFKRLAAAAAAVFTALVCFSGCAYNRSETETSDNTISVPEKYLNGSELELYEQLLECMKGVAEGERSADTFYFTVSRPFASTAAYEKSIKKVMYFIERYRPEYNYWQFSSGYRVYDKSRCAVVYGISPVYRSADNKIRSGRLYDVTNALEHAEIIADKYRGKSDYDKVLGYAEEICALNDYNREAADTDGYSLKDIDPWTFIYVFDRDPSTNVVCAGYGKAFQYLCELGGVECHYVTGDVKSGYHGWNIVVIDGVNYFVDVTNCDAYPLDAVKKYHPLVMNGVVSSTPSGFDSFFSSGGRTYSNTYVYDDRETEFLPEELRTISTTAYVPKKPKIGAIIVVVIFVVGTVHCFVKRRKRKFDEEY